MKKKLFALLLTICMALSLVVPAAAAQEVMVTIDGEAVAFNAESGSPFIDGNNRTLVPLRVTMETYGCDVFWDNEGRKAIVYRDGVTVVCPIGESYILVNGETVAIDTAAVIKNNRTYLPIRCVLEAVGATVGWNGERREVIVNRGETGVLLQQEEALQKALDAVTANVYLSSRHKNSIQAEVKRYLQNIPVDEKQLDKMCSRLRLVQVREAALGADFSGQCFTYDSRSFTITLDTVTENKISDEEEYQRVMFHELCHMFSNISTTEDWFQEGMTTVLEVAITEKEDYDIVLYDAYYRTCLLLLEVLGEETMLQAYLTGDESLIYAALDRYAGVTNSRNLLNTHVPAMTTAMKGGLYTWMGADQGKSRETWEAEYARSAEELTVLLKKAYAGHYGVETDRDPLVSAYLALLNKYTFLGTAQILCNPSIAYDSPFPGYFGRSTRRGFAVIKDKDKLWSTDGEVIVYR